MKLNQTLTTVQLHILGELYNNHRVLRKKKEHFIIYGFGRRDNISVKFTDYSFLRTNGYITEHKNEKRLGYIITEKGRLTVEIAAISRKVAEVI